MGKEIGGAIYIYRSAEMKIKMSDFDRNFNNNTGNEMGGAIAANYNAEIKIIMCNFNRNFNHNIGGAI